MRLLNWDSLHQLKLMDEHSKVLSLGLNPLFDSEELEHTSLNLAHSATSLVDSKGSRLTELEASKRIFKALKFDSMVTASDERVWVTLGLTDYLDYSKLRWPTTGDASAVTKNFQNHFLCGNSRMRFRDHPIASLWWRQHYINRVMPEDRLQAEVVLFDINSDLPVQLLGRPNIASTPRLARQIILELYKIFFTQKISYQRQLVRDLLMTLDLGAGHKIASFMSDDDAKLVIESRIKKLIASALDEEKLDGSED